jgi:hypothetical protein
VILSMARQRSTRQQRRAWCRIQRSGASRDRRRRAQRCLRHELALRHEVVERATRFLDVRVDEPTEREQGRCDVLVPSLRCVHRACRAELRKMTEKIAASIGAWVATPWREGGGRHPSTLRGARDV